MSQGPPRGQAADSSPICASASMIALFSMEVALDDAVPTFSGGLGVLAGDFLRSAADLALPVAGVSLLYRKGYFVQHLDASGRQSESPVDWSPESFLELLPEQVSIEVSGRPVKVRVWCRSIRGQSGAQVPLYLLDTDCEPNGDHDREITGQLYSGGREHRLRQEAVLGLGGLAVLDVLGYERGLFHMNEGHCSLLTIGLLEGMTKGGAAPLEDHVTSVREHCIFTTHTPVPAGHDLFEKETVRAVLGATRTKLLSDVGCLVGGTLNMTELGMRLSRFTNAVSLRHGEVSRKMFPDVHIRSITNGVHMSSWAAPAIQRLYDQHLPGWRAQNHLLRYATGIGLDELESAHHECKQSLLEAVHQSTGAVLDPDALTIGLARRATAYKRGALVFSDPDRLRSIVDRAGPIQIVCSGKAHPRDEPGKALIARIFTAAKTLDGALRVVFVEGYNLQLARLLCSGSDLWLNTPAKPHEASGTSGMKAAANGVPSLSILDGWWVEGCFEGVTGWSIGDRGCAGADASDVSGADASDVAGADAGAVGGDVPGADAEALYDKLEHVVAPQFFDDHRSYLWIMRNAIALNASFFNTERMVREYALNAYGLDPIVHGESTSPK